MILETKGLYHNTIDRKAPVAASSKHIEERRDPPPTPQRPVISDNK